MLDYNIFGDIAKRCGGDIRIGVVGPVRTGKSTLVKKFMTELVMPYATDEGVKGMAAEQLPQIDSGRDIVTSDVAFMPAKPVKVQLEKHEANVQLVDCVGYTVEGAGGLEADGKPRMATAPWREKSVPLKVAAAAFTADVAARYSDVQLLVTCDGSVADIPRESYADAEERAVKCLQNAGKPFAIILNCASPKGAEAVALKGELQEKYGVTVVNVNCEKIKAEGLMKMLKAVRFEFPVTRLDVTVPDWMRYLSPDNSAVGELLEKVRQYAPDISKMKDCSNLDNLLQGSNFWKSEAAITSHLSDGSACIFVSAKDGIYYEMLSEIAGDRIDGESSLMRYVRYAAEAKRSYDKVKDAFECARLGGYGIVQPDDEDISLEKPTVVRQGGSVGIKLKASAPSYHIVKIDVTGEASPIMGNAKQSEGIVAGMMNSFETDPEGMWETNVFGKSLKGMVKDGLAGKVFSMQEDTKVKMRRAMTRIVNEGKGGVICILL